MTARSEAVFQGIPTGSIARFVCASSSSQMMMFMLQALRARLCLWAKMQSKLKACRDDDGCVLKSSGHSTNGGAGVAKNAITTTARHSAV